MPILLPVPTTSQCRNAVDEALVHRALKMHLDAVATKNLTLLKQAFTPNALFIGTDDSEVWHIDWLSEFLMESKSGWDMRQCVRRIVTQDPLQTGESLSFFEVIVHKKYGTMRGSGIAVACRDEQCWRIAQYVLSISVPNHVIDSTNILQLLAMEE